MKGSHALSLFCRCVMHFCSSFTETPYRGQSQMTLLMSLVPRPSSLIARPSSLHSPRAVTTVLYYLRRSLADAVRIFPSEKAIVDYVQSADYDTRSPSVVDGQQTRTGAAAVDSDKEGAMRERGEGQEREEEEGKVGMAVIFNAAPAEGGAISWDYTLRFNYTYGVSMFEDQVRGRF